MKARKNIIRAMIIVSLLIMNVSCDQISKAIVRNRIDENEQISVVNPYFTLMRVENEGAFLSLGDSLPKMVRFVLLALFPLAVLGFGIGYLFFKRNISRSVLLGFAFVIGGGIGNLYDRLVYGSVTDFMHMNFVIFKTGIFNMADVSIMTGIGIVLIGSFLGKQNNNTEPVPATAENTGA
ncbi:MAG TPA: signal peptidase II [Cyclobacteriaceae bacterium]|nr:signal peptidase II [Cyclobacteriaceae bacterium]HMV08809.1 signal peptidase II [Cyclobacteriaceae bacterium]HMV90545.1 signal peptidase II [Cyclobacteriaceae bacterium]HMW99955.1 signal peptidase II [Cyclobacteriaceae bacterium]HMX49182.1 signal peptidase II [Cyclobacteriaceae bacterium]